jgi:hypothetical protein
MGSCLPAGRKGASALSGTEAPPFRAGSFNSDQGEAISGLEKLDANDIKLLVLSF